MPSPFGRRRGPSMYYQYGGMPYSYAANWDGMPSPSTRSAEARGLGADDDYIDVQFQGHLRKSLGDYETYPVALTSETGEKSVLHQVDQSHLYDAPPWQGLQGLGFFGTLSKNEKTLALVLAVGIGGYLFLKKRRK